MELECIDTGTTYIKTDKGTIFPSGVSENICLSSNVMTIAGKQYAMELFNDKAEYDTNINKGLNKNTRLNFIYALHKDAPKGDTMFQNVIVSLPCSQWKNQNTVQSFKEYLDIPDPINVDVNGVKKSFLIGQISVVPEDACSYFAPEMQSQRFDGRPVLILGFGSLTLNQILFKNDEPIDMHTDEFGVLKIYKDMAEKITSDTGFNVRMEEMQDILMNGLYIKGKLCDISETIRPIAMDFCRKVYRNLKLKWSIDTIPYVPMVGAGSIAIEKYFKEFVPHAELQSNAQLLSAIGMGEMAGVKA